MATLTDVRAFDDYFKAYSVAVMSGKERAELMYGGKSKPLSSAW